MLREKRTLSESWAVRKNKLPERQDFDPLVGVWGY